ncbi:MAG TPA: Spy/CpxP family protein refolding chaperone [Spirochaetota bacterium]|nr:Spy/CpxP family protein refolding chaperone [Spirochaetota bacterium]HPI89958.1 Spy/CpxP family protein refolding chaperone [Spirochaetota bacterium]HPR48443.1 Spy/CpxP family protein refolding chaperone [Spirochaetota bacterium]
MKKFFILAGGIVLGVLLTTSAIDARPSGPERVMPGDDEYIHERPGHHGRFRGGMCFGDPEFMKEKMGLSNEQIKEIEKINLKYRKFFLEKKEKLQPKRIKLRKLLLEEKVDLGDVRNILKDMSEIEVDIRIARIKQRIEIEKILTDEQKQKIRQHNRRGRIDND